MYTVFGINGSETTHLGNFTSLKNLDWALRKLEDLARETWIDNDYRFNTEKCLPNYKELVKIFKGRKDNAKVFYKVNSWLIETCEYNMGDYHIEIIHTQDNTVFHL